MFKYSDMTFLFEVTKYTLSTTFHEWAMIYQNDEGHPSDFKIKDDLPKLILMLGELWCVYCEIMGHVFIGFCV